MPDRQHIIDAINTHCVAESALDKATWMALFADDVVIEDPVGMGIWRGIEAVGSDFWQNVERAKPKLNLLQDVIVCGTEAIAIMSAEIEREGERTTLSPIVVNFVYNEEGKVRHLRSFMDYS